MHHAKRMVLVDERFLDNIWRKENTSWKRPIDQKAKSALHHSLQSDLEISELPDDIKAKSHQHHLSRFLHTARQLPQSQQQDLTNIEPVVDSLLKLNAEIPDQEPLEVKPKKQKIVEVEATPRRSKRRRRKSKVIEWEQWDRK